MTYKAEFLSFIKQYDVEHESAEDIYQDAVIALYQNFSTKKLSLEKSSLKTYLFGIGKNITYKHLQARNKQLSVVGELEDHQTIEFETPGLNRYQQELAKQLNNISDSCKELLRLYYYRNLTIQEIVDNSIYKDANTVKSHKSRCMKKLKSLVKI